MKTVGGFIHKWGHVEKSLRRNNSTNVCGLSNLNTICAAPNHCLAVYQVTAWLYENSRSSYQETKWWQMDRLGDYYRAYADFIKEFQQSSLQSDSHHPELWIIYTCNNYNSTMSSWEHPEVKKLWNTCIMLIRSNTNLHKQAIICVSRWFQKESDLILRRFSIQQPMHRKPLGHIPSHLHLKVHDHNLKTIKYRSQSQCALRWKGVPGYHYSSSDSVQAINLNTEWC